MVKAGPQEKIISIIGNQYFTLIADLINKWIARPPVPRDRITAPYYECGYAVLVIILLIASVESYVARDRFFSRKQPKDNHVAVPEFMKEIYRYGGYKRLVELFVVRDVIIHNHVWAQEYALIKTGGRRVHLRESNKLEWKQAA